MYASVLEMYQLFNRNSLLNIQQSALSYQCVIKEIFGETIESAFNLNKKKIRTEKFKEMQATNRAQIHTASEMYLQEFLFLEKVLILLNTKSNLIMIQDS